MFSNHWAILFHRLMQNMNQPAGPACGESFIACEPRGALDE